MTQQKTHSQTRGEKALAEILSLGYCRIRLDERETLRREALHREADKFFELELEDRLRYSVPNRTHGYRPFSYAHSGAANKPDLNDSFLHWKHRPEPLPHAEEISGFVEALEAWRADTAVIVEELLAALKEYYGYGRKLTFDDASVLQINSFAEKSSDELLQQVHEDAVLLTVIWTSAPGLEAVFGERIEALEFGPDEVAIMPGGILKLMTGGEIQPLYHQARNHGRLDRKSIMYFVSPDVTEPIAPYVVNEVNEGTDIRQAVIDNPQTFGLSEDFVPA